MFHWSTDAGMCRREPNARGSSMRQKLSAVQLLLWLSNLLKNGVGALPANMRHNNFKQAGPYTS